MKLLNVQSLDNSIQLTVETMRKLGLKKIQSIELENSLGMILAEDVIAKENIPAFRRSTMDGYAVKSTSTNGASQTIPTILTVVEEIEMGEEPQVAIKSSEASVIFTGGMLPEGADAVVPVENTEKVGDSFVSIYSPVTELQHVVDIGEDTKAGALYFKKGMRINANVIAGASSLGYTSLKVYTPLKCRVYSTGDEILPPDAEIPLGKTRDVNSYSISALCKELGLEVLERGHLPDVRQTIYETLARDDCDIVIVSGSSSKGKKDFVPTIIEEQFKPGMIFHGIAIKPGKPTSLGSDGTKIILGLPGHPVSAMAVFQSVFMKAYSDFFEIPQKPTLPCTLMESVHSAAGRTTIQFVRTEREENGYQCYPIFGASGNLSTLAKANGFFVINQQQEGVQKNQTVEVSLFDI